MSYGTSYEHIMRPPSFSLSSMVLHPPYPNEDCVGTDLTWLEDPCISLQGGQRQIFTGPSWQQQSNFAQHFDNGNMKSTIYSSNLSLALHSPSRPGMDAVSSAPQLVGPRMVSPVPSHDISTPTSSNARSPATDSEYPDSYGTPQIHDDLLFPSDVSISNTELGSACGGPRLPLFAQAAGYPCVNLSDVQAWSDSQEFVDPSEDVFVSPEAYLDMGQTEYSIEVDTQSSKGPDARTTYRPSPATHPQLQISNDAGFTQTEDRFEAATDMDADIEEEDELVEEEASDTDYTPKATRSTKRRSNYSSKLSSSSAKGRGRVTKGSRATKATKTPLTFPCKTCSVSFNSADMLKRHAENSHPRSFTCVFNFAGCDSTFGSKNEWKRHVSTQHLVFKTWTCNLDACGKAHDPASVAEKNASGGQASKGGSFNRKDLFTQHLRRMHPPPKTKRQDKQNNQKAKWEEMVKALQQSCMRINRSPPKALNCPVADCEAVFGGMKCWDDHMEHVAKHLEHAANTKGAPSVHHEDDESLVSWALTEGVIEHIDGVFKLITPEAYFERLEQDAEGESEY